jgi:hypothetical protein
VVSLLSPCPEASRRASQRIAQWTGWKPVVPTDTDDGARNDSTSTSTTISSSWNQVLINNALFTYSQTWHSRALQCPSTGTVLHWIALQKGNNASTSLSTVFAAAPHQLLAIQQAENLTAAQDFLAKTIQETSSRTNMVLNSVLLQRPMQAKHLLSSNPGGVPLLQFFLDEESLSCTSTNNNNNNDENDDDENDDDNDSTSKNTQSEESSSLLETRQFALKEIAISDHHHHHHDDDESSSSNMTLLQRLSKSLALSRPVTGLYQMPDDDGGGGVCLRPLPTGRQDWQVTPPSLVFHVDSLASILDLLSNKQDEAKNNKDDQAVSITKIGYSGMKNRPGQLMLRHADLNGIDVRFCQATTYSSMFAEAQESLLAGSLQELQSNHHGAKTGHCWVEFHANMKNPSGFIAKAKQGSMSKLLRRAKPQDLPFE